MRRAYWIVTYCYEDVTLNTPKLTLPHPRMHTRGFVLLPLFEIAPDISIPNHGKIAAYMTQSYCLASTNYHLQKITLSKLKHEHF